MLNQFKKKLWFILYNLLIFTFSKNKLTLFTKLKSDGLKANISFPKKYWINTSLKTKDEIDEAEDELKFIGLPLHPDKQKNWDALSALTLLLNNVKNKNDFILDSGGTKYSTILPWLSVYDYQNLYAIDLIFKKKFNIGQINYIPGDLTKTSFKDEMFAAITCLSVIEHGVNLKDYLKESYRILKPGGILITSTDYWHKKINTTNLRAYGHEIKIFSKSELVEFIEIAKNIGFQVKDNIDFDCNEKAVHWRRINLDFTFHSMMFKKP